MDKDIEGFDKISDLLDTSYAPEDSEEPTTLDTIQGDVQLFQEKKNELIVKSDVKTLEDKTYLQEETKELIDNGKLALSILQKELKVGASARAFEVYAKLLDSIVGGLKELRDLNKMLADMEMFNDFDKPKEANVNINMTGKEMLEMIKSAKENNQLNEIDATFEVESEPDK